MIYLRALLAVIFIVVSIYTLNVIALHGINFLPIFFGDIAALSWRGQFNADFTGFLILSALWVAWRHDFRPIGFILGLFALFGGILFLSAYLFVTSMSEAGDSKALLLGKRRAGR